MPGEVKNIAIVGANKEALKLLPLLLQERNSKVSLIVDSNKEAMLFKLNELGYWIAKHLDIKISTDLERLKRTPGLDIIINALQDPLTEMFLEQPEFRNVEKLGPLSARLLWGVRSASAGLQGHGTADEQAVLLASLREIVDAVRLTLDRKELLSVILRLAIESTRAERGSIMLLHREEGVLRVEIAKGMDEEVARKIRMPLGEGISGRVAKDGVPLLLSGKTSGEEFVRLRDRSDVKEAMCVPLVVNGEVIGVINVSTSESAYVFIHDDLNFLVSLAVLAAEVIQRSNEYERMKVDAAKFAFWKKVDALMSSPLPFEKRLNMVANKLVELVPGLTCFIYLYDEERNRLFLKAASIKDHKTLGPLCLRAGEGIEGSGMADAKDVILVDRTPESRTKRVYLSLPMAAHGALVGTFTGQVIGPQGLSAHHESFLKEIRSLLAESVYKYKRGEKETSRSRKILAVDEAGLDLISMKNPDRLLSTLAAIPVAILGAEGSVLRLKMERTNKFHMAATHGLSSKQVREYLLPIEKEAVLEVLRKKGTVSREFSEEASPYIKSILSRPLEMEGNIIGVISLFNKTSEETIIPCGFSTTDSDILARFAVYAEKAVAHFMGRAVPIAKEAAAKEEAVHPPHPAFEKGLEES